MKKVDFILDNPCLGLQGFKEVKLKIDSKEVQEFLQDKIHELEINISNAKDAINRYKTMLYKGE